jgi:DNA-binding CsgD family transcriptional regulator
MMKKIRPASVTSNKTRVEQAEARTERAEARTEQAKTRAELAETRTEQAETRTDLAKTRTEQAETRTEQAETALQHMIYKETVQETSTRLLKNITVDGTAGQQSPLEQLTIRQREILLLIAEGQNTKQIAEILKVSPKTVEYHRMKLMNCLNVHDIPGLVRLALRTGLVQQES